MANVGDVSGSRPQAAVSTAKGPAKAGGPEGISAAKARQNAEGAYDNLFFATSAEAGASATADVVVAQEDRVQEALQLFGELKQSFLKEAPKGAVADAFHELSSVFDKFGTTGFANGELELFNKSADGDLVPLNDAQKQEIGHAIDDALDRFWTKVTDSVPDPSKLKDTPAFAFLNTPKAQQILKTLGPVIQKLWTPPAVVNTESMAGAQSAKGLGAAKEAIAKAEAEEGKSSISPADQAKVKSGLEQLFSLGGDSVDIETLITMVMMDAGKDAALDMRASMQTLHARTEQKRQVRNQIAAMKAEHQSIDTQLRAAYAKDQHDGLIRKDVSYEDYCNCRTIQWGTYDPATGKVVPKSEIAPMTGPFPPTVGPTESLQDAYTFFAAGKTMKAGDTGPEVRELQMILSLAGYPVSVTGTMDQATIDALNKYKGAKSLSADGTVDAQTWDSLLGQAKMLPTNLAAFYASGGDMHVGCGASADAIREFQQLLKDAGYNVEVTGKLDQATDDAIHQIDPDGGIGVWKINDVIAKVSTYTLSPTQRFDALGGSLAKPPAPEGMSNLSGAQWDALVDNCNTQLDTLGDQSQEDQMKMQMTLDRYTKAFDTLSNIMKKIAQSADTIVGNLK